MIGRKEFIRKGKDGKKIEKERIEFKKWCLKIESKAKFVCSNIVECNWGIGFCHIGMVFQEHINYEKLSFGERVNGFCIFQSDNSNPLCLFPFSHLSLSLIPFGVFSQKTVYSSLLSTHQLFFFFWGEKIK